MADLMFSKADADRRRRMLAASQLDQMSDELVEPALGDQHMVPHAVLPSLSRDQLIRRLISPRIWKHVVLACLLLGPPLFAGLRTMLSTAMLSTAGLTELASGSVADQHEYAAMLQGISGLQLFVCSQLCLLICWVRAASSRDFRGVYRAWRWMAILLFGTSLFLLTGAAPHASQMLAEFLQRIIGPITAARKTLLVVPVLLISAFVLWRLIPDMSRCRWGQSFAVAAAVVAAIRVSPGLRSASLAGSLMPGILEWLACSLALTAFQLNARYVIYVSADPPAAGTVKTRSAASIPAIKETDECHRGNEAPSDLLMIAGMANPEVDESTLEESLSPSTPADESDSGDEVSSSKRAATKSASRARSPKKSTRKAG